MSPADPSSAASPPGIDASRRQVAWIGPADTPELALARDWTAAIATVLTIESPAAAAAAADPVAGPWPTLAVLATDMPGRWTLADAIHVSRQWPLAPIVSVCTELAAGRRRSGPPLPGIEEVAWNDFPSRLAGWLADLDAGRPGALGLPAAARREDRVLEAVASLRQAAIGSAATRRACVAARRGPDLDGTAAVIAACGLDVTHQVVGRPPLGADVDLVVWDVERIDADALTWLQMLAAQSPGLAVVLLEAFPRGDTTRAAVAAGAAAVLGSPASLEALVGTLRRLDRPRDPDSASPIAPQA